MSNRLHSARRAHRSPARARLRGRRARAAIRWCLWTLRGVPSALALLLLLSSASAPLAAQPRSRTAQPAPAPQARLAPAGEEEPPPADAELLPPEERPYESITLEVVGLRWLGPGQQGLVEAHPLIMGLAAMALATVALIFFFLRGVKRPRPEGS